MSIGIINPTVIPNWPRAQATTTACLSWPFSSRYKHTLSQTWTFYILNRIIYCYNPPPSPKGWWTQWGIWQAHFVHARHSPERSPPRSDQHKHAKTNARLISLFSLQCHDKVQFYLINDNVLFVFKISQKTPMTIGRIQARWQLRRAVNASHGLCSRIILKSAKTKY